MNNFGLYVAVVVADLIGFAIFQYGFCWLISWFIDII